MPRHAAVLVKQILDPELPPSRFRVDPATRMPPPGLGPELLGPFEQSALEVALQLRDAGGVERVTALAAGPPSAAEALRKALALRVDEAVHVVLGEGEAPDPAQIAELLARAVERLEGVDVVLAGRQAGDWDHGQVGYLVAERLGWPCIGFAQGLAVEDGALVARRERAHAAEALAADPPVVVTVTNHDSNRLRMARVTDVLMADRKPLTELAPADLGLDGPSLEDARRIELLEVALPEREGSCELIDGEGPAEVAAELVRRLEELKLLGERA